MYKVIFAVSLLLAFQPISAATGKHIYKKECANCHGKHGEKHALGISRPIHGMKYKKSMAMISAYAGGKQHTSSMVKGVKRHFLKKHTAQEVESVSRYIETLK